MKRALVLSGGGSKGSYQLGVYKALRKLRIDIDIITGTSIGSINGAFLVSGDYKKLKKLWLNTKTSELLNYSFSSAKDYKDAAKEIVINKGLKFNKAEKFLENLLDENRIRKSKIDYGLVTVNFKTRAPKMLSKDEIPKGKLVPYIIASATCFPAVEMKEIDGEYYVDGGYYDNLPINLAIDMGAEEIIAVDLSAVGIKKKVKDKNVKIDLIKNSNPQKFNINFDPEVAKENIIRGYNDTMKYYKKLDGKSYTFKKNNLAKNVDLINEKYVNLIKKILLSGNSNLVVKEILKNKRYENIFLNIKQNKLLDKEINNSLEYLGELFELDKNKVYNISVFNRKLIGEVKQLDYISIDKNLKGKMLIGYIYNTYMNSDDKEEVYKKLYNIALIFQKDFLAAIYLIAISTRRSIELRSDSFYEEILNHLKK